MAVVFRLFITVDFVRNYRLLLFEFDFHIFYSLFHLPASFVKILLGKMHSITVQPVCVLIMMGSISKTAPTKRINNLV